ncbi:MAG: hypothetical protein [Podoviridae sp. ctrTa16]|nr:MAG: hypothetical protein [Podoviridae sp. ctrTa16]
MPLNSGAQNSTPIETGRSIQPVSVWVNGRLLSANNIVASVVSDNLATSATFYYRLVAVDGEVSTFAAEGNLVMDGEDYQNWGVSGDINQEAYVWMATKLNLTLV